MLRSHLSASEKKGIERQITVNFQTSPQTQPLLDQLDDFYKEPELHWGAYFEFFEPSLYCLMILSL
jgi:hypothetical protein